MNKLYFFTTDPKEVAIKSWLRYAELIFIFNDKSINDKKVKEINIKKIELFNKKTFKISDAIKEAKKITNRFVLINGDIELKQDDKSWEKISNKKGLVCGQRFNYLKSYEDSKINLGGIDFFIIENLQVSNDDNFCFGLPCWDWWIVYLAQLQKLNISFIKFPFFFHKTHKRNWEQSCLYMINHFEKATNKKINDFRKSFINFI